MAAARVVILLLAASTWLRGETLEIEARLLAITPPPTVEQVRPYPRALATYLYEVRAVHRGTCKEKRILVVKWAVWNRRPLPGLPVKPGTIARLKLDHFIDHPGLRGARIVDRILERELRLYYEPSSRPPPEVAKALAGKAEELDRGVVGGTRKGWLFLADELEHAREGRFWEKPWKQVSRAGVDPLPALLDFQKRLQAVGVGLLVVPVPTKVSIYPDCLAAGLQATTIPSDYLKLLELAGLNILDLHPLFHEHRQDPGHQALYCTQDTHWTPEACRLAAQAIYRKLEGQDPPGHADLRPGARQIRGDLARMRKAPALPVEKIDFDEVIYPASRGSHGYDYPTSDVILLGDSNIAVFSDPKEELHGPGGGLPDYLSLYLGRELDVIAAFGDGVHQARLNLYRWRSIRDPGYWKNKRWVVWCFTMREFTRAEQWSTEVPLVKNP